MRQWLLQRLLSAVHLNCEKASQPPTFSSIEPVIQQIESNQPYIDIKILHTFEKSIPKMWRNLFVKNDFMPPVMTWKQFSSSLQPTCDWYRNNVRNAEAFMKSRLLFLEMIAQKSLKKLQLEPNFCGHLKCFFAVSLHIQIMLQALTNLWHQDRKVYAMIKQALLERIKPLFGIVKAKSN